MVSVNPSAQTGPHMPEQPAAGTGTRTVPTTHVVLPAYNEAASLPPLLERLGGLAAGWGERMTVWVVDDGSTDGTAEIARQGSEGLDVRVVSHPVNLGLGQAVHSGLRAAIAAADDDDAVVVMDADDTHDVGLVPVLQRALQDGADLAIASRFVGGGDDSTAPPFRRLLSRGAAVLFRSALPLDGVRDFTSGYRAYRVALLRRASGHYGERLIEEQGFACMVELLLKLRHCHPVVVEVPLVLRYDRKQGASKLRLGRTVLQYLELLVRDRLAPPPFRGL
ncbi:glycosyltransferase family 2 protein [Modestobacter sp. URMC 112]